MTTVTEDKAGVGMGRRSVPVSGEIPGRPADRGSAASGGMNRGSATDAGEVASPDEALWRPRDLLLPALLFLAGIPLTWANYGSAPVPLLLHTVLCAALLPRRQFPVGSFLVIAAVAVAAPFLAGVHILGELALFATYYRILLHRPVLWGLGATVVTVAVLGLLTVRPLGDLPLYISEGFRTEATTLVEVLIRLLTSMLLIVVALVTGVIALVARDRRRAVADARVEADRMRAERDQRSRLAREEERTRIARELHDVVGHSLGVMVSLSDGAARLVGPQPERAGQAMTTVADTGRAALAEVRDVLGLLRDDSGQPPQVQDVSDLVERVRATGTPVNLVHERELTRLPEHVRLCVYRVVQEALTNVGRHAGPGAEARVRVAGGGERVEVTVTDDGPGRPAERGSGLTGLTERVGLQGGTLTAGPGPGGGWVVHAVLPVRRPAAEVGLP